MKLFGWSFQRNRVGHFCWRPCRLTLRSHPAIYKWLGIAFSPYWSHEIYELRKQRDRYRSALAASLSYMDLMLWHVADAELRESAAYFSTQWSDTIARDSE